MEGSQEGKEEGKEGRKRGRKGERNTRGKLGGIRSPSPMVIGRAQCSKAVGISAEGSGRQ